MATLPPPMTTTSSRPRKAWPSRTSFRYSTPQRTLGFGSRYRQAHRFGGPDADKHGLVAVPGEQIIDAQAGANRGVQADVHSHTPHIVNFPVQHILGQAVARGYPRPACLRPPGVFQILLPDSPAASGNRPRTCRRGRPPRWRLSARPLLRDGRRRIQACLNLVVSQKALGVANGQRRIHLAPLTGRLAGTYTNAPARRGKRHALAHQGQGFSKFSGSCQGHVALGVDARPDRHSGREACRPAGWQRCWEWPGERDG